MLAIHYSTIISGLMLIQTEPPKKIILDVSASKIKKYNYYPFVQLYWFSEPYLGPYFLLNDGNL